MIRDTGDAMVRIEFAKLDGVVTLDGEIAGPGGRCFTGAFAWWAPGLRNVTKVPDNQP